MGIHSIELLEDEQGVKTVNTMISLLKEHVKFTEPVIVAKEIEIWLNKLTDQMKGSLKSQLMLVMKQPSIDWTMPAQLLGLSEETKFVASVIECYEKSPKLSSQIRTGLQAKLTKYTAEKAKLSELEQSKCKSLILDIIHNIGVAEMLEAKESSGMDDWDWFKQ
jgi:hypothetical protein